MENPLVSLASINPRIILDIRYATENNFLGRKVYSKPQAYLRKSTAQKLDRAQQVLEKKGLGLKVWDAYRPEPVQRELWNFMPDERYVAHPDKGSVHSRGGAVDVTLVDAQGHELEMPTGFDEFSQRAFLNYPDLSDAIRAHRELLCSVMVDAGFDALETEWWHYADRESARFPLESISFEELERLQSLF